MNVRAHTIGVIAASLLMPLAARAQTMTGTITGVVRDADGAALPGVNVEVSSDGLIEKTRSVLTDSRGGYMIADLRPGTYSVSFAMPGFESIVRDGFELSGGTVTVDIAMHQDPPSIDLRNVSLKAVTARSAMDALPTDRNFISFAALTPGMQVVGALQNVGGAVPETPMMLQIHGTRVGESRLFVDGMSVMSGNSTGGLNFGNFPNNAMGEEVVVHADNLPAEFELSGVTANVVSRQGSNIRQAAFDGRYAGSQFESDNLSADLVSRGLASASRMKRIWDANPSIGGPVVKDRFWQFSSFRHWGTQNYIAGLFDDLDPAALFYTPDRTRPSIYPVSHASADTRLTIQASPRQRFGAYYEFQFTDFGTCTTATLLTAPSGCAHNKNNPQWFVQGNWTARLTSRLSLEAGATTTLQEASGRRDPGVRDDLPAITEQSTNFTWRAPAGGFGGTRNRQTNYRAALSITSGSHAAKIGMTLIQLWRFMYASRNSGVNYLFSNSVPLRVTQFAEPATYRERVNMNLGLYAQDQWTLRRLTLNLGVRADFLNAQVDAQNLPAGRFVPARAFEEIENAPNWQDVSPRLGAAYNLFGNGRTAVKATLGRYVVGESYGIARGVNPVQSTVPSATRTWDDNFYPAGDPRRGNFVPDCDLRIVTANDECGPADPVTFGQVVVTSHYDEGLTRGFGVRPYNWGSSITVQHELVPRVTLSAGYFRRWYGNFTILSGNTPITKNRTVTNADFTSYCIVAPQDARLPNGGGNQICGFYDVSLEKFGQVDNLITTADHVGRQEDVFDGFDFTFSARLPDRALLAGGVSLGRERTNTCYVIDDRSVLFTATSPRSPEFCDVHPPLRPNVKLQGVYPLPWWGIQIAATFQSIAGPQILAQRPTMNAQIRPSLGRNLASCGAAPTCTDNVLLDLIPPGTLYGEWIYQVDVRFSRTIRRGRLAIRPMVSVYNLLNASPVLQYSNRFNANWPAPTAILTARFADFGVQIDFR
jgi:Carboxypeptidase regulatory-like domain